MLKARKKTMRAFKNNVEHRFEVAEQGCLLKFPWGASRDHPISSPGHRFWSIPQFFGWTSTYSSRDPSSILLGFKPIIPSARPAERTGVRFLEMNSDPGEAGFQRESLGWKYECVDDNNAQNHNGEMQKAADRHRPELPHNFFLSSWRFLMRKKRGASLFFETTAIWN